jgi:hypothetical protein
MKGSVRGGFGWNHPRSSQLFRAFNHFDNGWKPAEVWRIGERCTAEEIVLPPYDGAVQHIKTDFGAIFFVTWRQMLV